MYIQFKKEDKITRGEGNYFIDNYLTKDKSKNISVAVSHLNGCSIDKTKNIESDRVYYFIKADAEFKINNEIVNVKDGDVLYIEKNTSYSMKGHFDAVLINTPAFDIKNEIKE